jgi:hypothetical protein
MGGSCHDFIMSMHAVTLEAVLKPDDAGTRGADATPLAGAETVVSDMARTVREGRTARAKVV